MLERSPPHPALLPDDSPPPSMDMNLFLMSSAHDMKNSISIMTAYLESALADLPAEATSRNMTCQALYEAQRLNHHLIQLLALYKIDQNLYPFDPVEVEIAAFEREVLARVQPFARAKGITLEVVSDQAEPSWYFDYELIISLVTQSLHNAVRYARSQVLLSLRMIDEQLEICVNDDGDGFPPFLLVPGAAATQGVNSLTGSTGLGIHFASQVAYLHRNRSRRGSTRLENGGLLGGGHFTLTLP